MNGFLYCSWCFRVRSRRIFFIACFFLVFLSFCFYSRKGVADELVPQNVNQLHTQDYPVESPSVQVVLPVLVIACNRIEVKRTIDALLLYRSQVKSLPPQAFPIFVSHGCVHRETSQLLQSYGTQINVLEFKPKIDRRLSQVLRGYQSAALHYKFALDTMFIELSYSVSVVIEDDLDIAPDLFEYFLATLPILRTDPSLFCVSAWNDNGRPQLIDSTRPDVLYRTDFFPGLGWMLLQKLWLEIRSNFTDIYWDEYMRQPHVRKERSCIRPEIGRTITFGRTGISRGQYFDKYLKSMQLAKEKYDFLKHDMNYLRKDIYDQQWTRLVFEKSVEITLNDLLSDKLPALTGNDPSLRVTYNGQEQFMAISTKLGLLGDVKSGVMRNAYLGVVPVKWKGFWLYVAPPPSWKRYDLAWK